MLNVIILGPAGSGKGVQSSMLSKSYSIPHVSTGTLLRDRVQVGDELAKDIENVISNGNLVSDDLMFDILLNRLKRNDCLNGFVLDGFPRNINQAEEFDCVLKNINNNDTVVLVLDVSDDVVIKRISGRFNCKNCKAIYNKFYKNTLVDGVCDECGSNEFFVRNDDCDINSITNRLNIYKNMFKPIIDFYKKKNLIYFVDGNNIENKICEDIKIIINSKLI